MIPEADEAGGTADRDGARHPGGRPRHAPTQARRDEVYRMASIDVSVEAIAAVIGIPADTLREHYASELVEGWADGTAWLVDKLRRLADGGNKKARKLLAALSAHLAAIEARAARGASTAGPPWGALASSRPRRGADAPRAGSPARRGQE